MPSVVGAVTKGAVFDYIVDSDDVSFVAAVVADWDGGVSPAAANLAFDQLAERLTDVEGAGGHDEVTLAADAETVLNLSDQEIGLVAQNANEVFAGPDAGADADPAFRALVADDIPDISATYLTPGDHTAIGDGAPHHARDHTMTGTSDHSAGYWKLFYSDASGDVQELALGSDGQVLTSTGAAGAPAFEDAGGHAQSHDHSAAGDGQTLQPLQYKWPVGTELTIAAGAITVTESYHGIDTEGGAASDNLDTINGIVSGGWYLLRPSTTGHTVVIRHLGGIGNIYCVGNRDFTLNDPQDYVLVFGIGNVPYAMFGDPAALVGDAPGGELGGTWASPTVDATHSGSAHHTRSHTLTSASDHTGTADRVIYVDHAGAVQELALGADGTVLTSTGAATAPAFEAPAAGGGGAADAAFLF
jgi:hypothetical protein